MKFYKDIIAEAETRIEGCKRLYHEWSPQSIKSYWSACTNNPFVRAQFYPSDYWEDLLEWAAKNISTPPANIVDVGCGNGNLIDCITRTYRNALIVGVDLSDESFEPARQRFDGCNNVRFKVGSLDRLPFDDNSVDLVTCTEVLEHTFPETFTCAFAEVRRVLRKSGYFLASVPFDEKIAFVCCPACRSFFTPYQHMMFEISHEDIQRLASKNGFEIVAFYQSMDLSRPNSRFKRAFKPFIIKRLPAFAARIFPKAGVSGFLARKRARLVSSRHT
jgi:ubiquinone/menaquinone biosynthesis C-methylase UbiE